MAGGTAGIIRDTRNGTTTDSGDMAAEATSYQLSHRATRRLSIELLLAPVAVNFLNRLLGAAVPLKDSLEQSGPGRVELPRIATRISVMDGIIYLVGLIVIVMAILSFLGLH